MAKKLEKEDWAKVTITGKQCPKARLAFPSLFKPSKKKREEDPNKWEATLLFPKRTDLTALKKAVHAAKVLQWGPKKEKWPKGLRDPFTDGDEKEWNGYAGCIAVKATGYKRPGVVDGALNRIEEDESDLVYPGCYVKATMFAKAYDTDGNRGVAFRLKGIQKIGDGERLDRQFNVEDDFEAEEDASEVESSYEEESSDSEDSYEDEDFE